MMQTSVYDSMKYKFHFLKYRYVWLAVSVIYLVIGLGAYFVKGGFKYYIDFAGGTEVRISLEKTSDISQVRQAMSERGWKDVSIQSVGNNGSEFIVHVASASSDAANRIKSDLETVLVGNKVTITGTQWVGPEVGTETTWNAIMAVLMCMLVILLYIAVRFEFRFGMGAVAALVHDMLAVLVFLLLIEEPISLNILASFIAVLGYSVHDTIVIFNRMRDNFVKLRGLPEEEIADISINQTLSRTLLTSGATLLAVLAIFLWGGQTLHGLSLVMLVGIIVGTYSSIYIASPMMLAVKTKKASAE